MRRSSPDISEEPIDIWESVINMHLVQIMEGVEWVGLIESATTNRGNIQALEKVDRYNGDEACPATALLAPKGHEIWRVKKPSPVNSRNIVARGRATVEAIFDPEVVARTNRRVLNEIVVRSDPV
jgi:hypothetical protein